jgi:uncharacterized membrane protein YsdA (DUF1294 family)
MMADDRRVKPRPDAAQNRTPRRFAHWKVVVLAVVLALPVAGTALALFAGFWMPAVVYLAMSFLAMLLYWRDKRQARANGWRTPEKMLHAAELLGGWPGALIAQQLLRHKTRKVSFQVVFWIIVLLHQVIWVDYLFLGVNVVSGGFFR